MLSFSPSSRRSRTGCSPTSVSARAAAKAGDTAKAREHSKKIVAMAGSADKSRTEIAEARATLNGKKK